MGCPVTNITYRRDSAVDSKNCYSNLGLVLLILKVKNQRSLKIRSLSSEGISRKEPKGEKGEGGISSGPLGKRFS